MEKSVNHGKISKLFLDTHRIHISMQGHKKRTCHRRSFVLDIIQATFVTVSIVDLPTSSLNSQGTGAHAKPSNATKHMPTQLWL